MGSDLNVMAKISVPFEGLYSSSRRYTVKPVLSGHLEIDKRMVLMENGSLMKVDRIAECIPQYF